MQPNLEITQVLEKTKSSTQAFIMSYSNQMRAPISEMRGLLLELRKSGQTSKLAEVRCRLEKMEQLLDNQVVRLLS
jgi:hypothetical protein